MKYELVAIEIYENKNVKDTIFNFNKNYKISKEKEKYEIEKVNNIEYNQYSNINFSCLVGKNGSGKSVVIEALGNFKNIFIIYCNKLYRLDGHWGNYNLVKSINNLATTELPLMVGEISEIYIKRQETEAVKDISIKGPFKLFEANAQIISLYDTLLFYKNYIKNTSSYLFDENVKLELSYNYTVEENEDIIQYTINCLNDKFDTHFLVERYHSINDDLQRHGGEGYDSIFLTKDNIKNVANKLNSVADDSGYENTLINFLEEFNTVASFQISNSYEDIMSEQFEIFSKILSKYSYDKFLKLDIINMPTGYKTLEKIERIIKESKENTFTLILFDELDFSLHPELQRCLKSEINKMIEFYKFNTRCIHIIYTTHSPFLTQGFFKNEIYRLECGVNTNNIINIHSMSSTFGKNIIDILYDSFYLESNYGVELFDQKTDRVIEGIGNLIEDKMLRKLYNDKTRVR